MSLSLKVAFVGLALLLGACTHPIEFEQVSYPVAPVDETRDAVVVIPAESEARRESVRSMMTGLAHEWDIHAGRMLRQVAEIELPQMLGDVTFAEERPAAAGAAATADAAGQPLHVVLALVDYGFADFRASTQVRAQVFAPGVDAALLDRTYTAVGDGQGGKMFVGGAFAMKSAVRQSSLEAYQSIFRQFREDLDAALRKAPAGTPMARSEPAATVVLAAVE